MGATNQQPTIFIPRPLTPGETAAVLASRQAPFPANAGQRQEWDREAWLKALPRAVILPSGKRLDRVMEWSPPGVSPARCHGWAYRDRQGTSVLFTVDVLEVWGPLCHLSIAHRRADPPWQEIKWVRERFFPTTLDVMQLLPRASEYVNIHVHCFHLWECPQGWADDMARLPIGTGGGQ